MSDGDMAGDAADSNDGVGEVAKIKIRSTNGPKFCVHANLNSTVLSFKTIVAQKCEVPPPQQRLIHKGCIMKDDQTLRSYGLEGDHTVYLVRGSVPAAPAAGTTTNTAGNPELWREVTVRECLNALRQLTVSEAYAAGRMHRNLGALDIFVGNTMPFGRLFPELQVDSALDLTTNETNELMQDPEISQTMHNMLSNPQYLNQMLAFNPELQYVLHRQPWIRDAMQNPEFIRRLATPQIVLALLIYHRGLVFQAAREEGLTDEEKGFDTAAWGLEKLRNVFGEVATRAGIASAATASRPQGPEEQYATQLSQLQEMGFFDTQENIRALIATAGNVQAAVARLLGI